MAYKRISPQPIVEGGTNATSMATTDGVVYYDGTRLVTTSAGNSGEVLTSNGGGVAPTYQAAPGTINFLSAYVNNGQGSHLGNGDHLIFDTVITSSGSSITLDTTSAYSNSAGTASVGRFTFTSGSYYISMTIPVILYNNDGGNIDLSFFDTAALTPLVTVTSTETPKTYTGPTRSDSSAMTFIFTTGSTVTTEFNFTSINNVTNLGISTFAPMISIMKVG